jgi:hypothetical protein
LRLFDSLRRTEDVRLRSSKIARLASGLFDQPAKNILPAEKGQLRRCAAMILLDVRKEYACARPSSCSLHLDFFQQPSKNILLAEKPPASSWSIAERKLE